MAPTIFLYDVASINLNLSLLHKKDKTKQHPPERLIFGFVKGSVQGFVIMTASEHNETPKQCAILCQNPSTLMMMAGWSDLLTRTTA